MKPEQTTCMLVFRESSLDTYARMSLDETRACLQTWNAWVGELVAQGKLQAGHPLEPTGRVVRGARAEKVLDGPFSEAKEFIGGYLLLTVADLDEATAIAQRCPNLKHGMVVEVREVATGCHLAKRLGLSSMHETAPA